MYDALTQKDRGGSQLQYVRKPCHSYSYIKPPCRAVSSEPFVLAKVFARGFNRRNNLVRGQCALTSTPLPDIPHRSHTNVSAVYACIVAAGGDSPVDDRVSHLSRIRLSVYVGVRVVGLHTQPLERDNGGLVPLPPPPPPPGDIITSLEFALKNRKVAGDGG